MIWLKIKIKTLICKRAKVRKITRNKKKTTLQNDDNKIVIMTNCVFQFRINIDWSFSHIPCMYVFYCIDFKPHRLSNLILTATDDAVRMSLQLSSIYIYIYRSCFCSFYTYTRLVLLFYTHTFLLTKSIFTRLCYYYYYIVNYIVRTAEKINVSFCHSSKKSFSNLTRPRID